MTMHVKNDKMYLDEEFDSPEELMRWANGQIAKLRKNWTLAGIDVNTTQKGQHWCGLTFEVVDMEPIYA